MKGGSSYGRFLRTIRKKMSLLPSKTARRRILTPPRKKKDLIISQKLHLG